MTKYVINRDKINLGTIIRPIIRMYDADNLTKVDIYGYHNIRLVLFSINENNLSNDLLYNSPNYPIENISDLKECANSKYVINKTYNLDEFLTNLGFDEELTKRDLKKLRNKLLYSEDVKQLPDEVYDHIRKLNRFNPSKSEGKIKRLK